MTRILVTGASGFIGRHVVERLAAAGHEVVANGRDAARLRTLDGIAGRIAVADLADADLGPLLDGCETVVHCAALSSPWGRPEAFWRANVTATERLLAASRDAGVRRFVHLGSPSIYFRFEDQYDLGEDFTPPRHWITDYARSKWESELRVRAATSARMETLILRPRAVFGRGDTAILPRLLAVARRGWFPLVHRGRALIDVTCVDNLADLIQRCVAIDLPANGAAYNVTNGEPIRVSELLSPLFASLDSKVRLVPVPRSLAVGLAGLAESLSRLRPGQPEPRLTRYGIGVLGYSQTLDISRARRDLGYAPTLRLRDGIDQFLRATRPA